MYVTQSFRTILGLIKLFWISCSAISTPWLLESWIIDLFRRSDLKIRISFHLVLSFFYWFWELFRFLTLQLWFFFIDFIGQFFFILFFLLIFFIVQMTNNNEIFDDPIFFIHTLFMESSWTLHTLKQIRIFFSTLMAMMLVTYQYFPFVFFLQTLLMIKVITLRTFEYQIWFMIVLLKLFICS